MSRLLIDKSDEISFDENSLTLATTFPSSPGLMATLYVDFENGSEFNDGLSSGAPVKTLARALTIAKSTGGDQNIKLMAGIHQIESLISLDATSGPGAGVTWNIFSDGDAIISSKLQAFSADTETGNDDQWGRKCYVNPINQVPTQLFSADLQTVYEHTNNLDGNGDPIFSVNRHGGGVPAIQDTTEDSIVKLLIGVDDTTHTLLDGLDSNELISIFVTLYHSYTISFDRIQSYDDSNKQIKIRGGGANSALNIFTNGYAEAGELTTAPYVLTNLPDSDTTKFYANFGYLYAPDGVTSGVIPDRTLTRHFYFDSVPGVLAFYNIEFAGIGVADSYLRKGNGNQNEPSNTAGFFEIKNTESFVFKNCYVHDVYGCNAFINAIGDCSDADVSNNKVRNHGDAFVMFNRIGDYGGGTYAFGSGIQVNDNDIDGISTRDMGMPGILIAGGTSVDQNEVRRNLIKNGSGAAIHLAKLTVLGGTLPSVSAYDKSSCHCQGNIIHDMGMRNGLTAPRYSTADMGAIYVARWQDGSVVEDNIVFNVMGYGEATGTTLQRGIYLDDGVYGTTVRNNIFFNIEFWDIYLPERSSLVGHSDNNEISNNLTQKAMLMQGRDGYENQSVFSDNVIIEAKRVYLTNTSSTNYTRGVWSRIGTNRLTVLRSELLAAGFNTNIPLFN